jgi:hypothetical protein
MLTADSFRRIALSLDGAPEGAHRGHANFRGGWRTFASLGYRDEGRAMVKGLPADQQSLVTARHDAFAPATGAWGVGGATMVDLRRAPAALVRTAIAAALRLATTPKVRRAAAATRRRQQGVRRAARPRR